MSFDLKGKVAVITGGLGGIGLEIVKLLLDNIKGITIVDVNENLADKVLQELNSSKVLFCKADVAKKDEFEAAFKKTVETFKNVDILINNAGVANDLQWEKMIPVNLNGVINGTLLAMDHYILNHKTGDEGVIVNIASVAGLTPLDSFPLYSSTKSAVVQLTRGFGTNFHYTRTKIRVVAICPGSTDTELVKGMYTSCLQKEFRERFLERSSVFTPQKAFHVAKTVGEVINKGENGCVWVVEGGEVYEIRFPHYKQLSVDV